MPWVAERAVNLRSGGLQLRRALFLPAWIPHLENTGAGSNKLATFAFRACGDFTFSEFTLQKKHGKRKYAGLVVLINSWSSK